LGDKKALTREENTIEHKLASWLRKQGYPLEMVVARAFGKAGFSIIQSEYYKDPETGIFREIDLSAHAMNDVHDVLLEVNFTIECKLARDKPWVMFTSSNISLADPARITQRASSTLGQALLESICKRKDICSLPLFYVPERPGYGLTQVFTSGQDAPFSAVMGAAKASLAEVKFSDEVSRTHGPICEVSFPVVVIDGLLFECHLNQAGEVETEPISSGTLLWRSPVIGMPHTIVHIVTLPAVDKFVQGAIETARTLLGSCNGELEKLLKQIPRNARRVNDSSAS
jgi:hypothetical protein